MHSKAQRLTSGDDGVDRFLRPGAFSVLTGKHVPIRKNDLQTGSEYTKGARSGLPTGTFCSKEASYKFVTGPTILNLVLKCLSEFSFKL